MSEVFIRALTTKDKNEKRQSYWIIIFLWFAKNKTWCITEISLNLVIPKNYTSQSELTRTMILLSFIGFQNFAHVANLCRWGTKDERISFSQKAKGWGNAQKARFFFSSFFFFLFFQKVGLTLNPEKPIGNPQQRKSKKLFVASEI